MLVKPKKMGVVFFILIFLFSFSAFSQKQTGSLWGKITDSSGTTLPGVTVTVFGPSLQGKLSFISTDLGTYRFPSLPPGTYTVTAQLSGFKKVVIKGVRIMVGKTTTLNIKMEIAKLEETITVTAESSGVDIKTPKQSVVYPKELLESIPTGRDIYDITDFIPGSVSEGVDYRRTFSVHGTSVRSNQFAFDGLIMNDPVQGYMGTNINYDAFEEVELETAGHPAEVGASGAYVNVVTKSGGNRFSGEVQLYYTSKDTVDKSALTDEYLDSIGISGLSFPKINTDIAFSLGGPIKKDKLWFFISARRLSELWDVEHPDLSRFWYVREDALQKAEFADEAEHTEYMLFGKLTYSPSSAHKFSLSYNLSYPHEPHRVDDLRSTSDIFTLKAAKEEKIPTHSAYLKWEWTINQNAYLDTRAGFMIRDFQHLPPQGAGPTVEYWYYFDYALITNGPWRSDRYVRKRYTAQTALTYYLEKFLGGEHEVKTGIDLEYGGEDWHMWSLGLSGNIAGLSGDNLFPTQITWFYPYYSKNFYQLWIHALPTSDDGGHILKGRKLKVGYYIQDNISLLKGRLNINAGLRIDYAKVYFPAQHAAGAPSWQKLLDEGILPKFPDMDDDWFGPRDYPEISLAGMTSVTPRIGISYDLTGDSKTAIKLFYGEYSEPPVLYTGYNVNPMAKFLVRYYWWDANDNFIIDDGDEFYLKRFWEDRPTEAPDPSYYMDPDLKPQKTREIVVGISRELLPNFNITINYINREDKNIIDDIDIGATVENGGWVPFEFTAPGVDGVFGTADDITDTLYAYSYTQSSHYWITNVSSAKRKYEGIEITFHKAMSHRWQLYGVLTFSKTTGNIGVWYTQTNGRSAAFDSPNWTIVHKPDYRLSSDRPFTLRLQGTYIAPYDILMSFNYFHSAGAPAEHYILVQSPYSSWDFYTYYLDEPGSIRYPSTDTLDIRIGKDFTLPKGKLGIYVDIFNALNKITPYISIGNMGTLYADGTFVKNDNQNWLSGISDPRIFRFDIKYSF